MTKSCLLNHVCDILTDISTLEIGAFRARPCSIVSCRANCCKYRANDDGIVLLDIGYLQNCYTIILL